MSNASDALDKIAFLATTDPTHLDGGAQLEVRIRATPAAAARETWAGPYPLSEGSPGVLEIMDTGVGMTKESLAANLGTIARSGTANFVSEMLGNQDDDDDDDGSQQKAGSKLIGQFGVGFYSVYLVADRVDVTSRAAGEPVAHVWSSDGKGGYSIDALSEEASANVPRGTTLRLHLREEAAEFLEETKIRDVVKTHSQFIDYPISLEVTREVERELPGVPASALRGADGHIADGEIDQDAEASIEIDPTEPLAEDEEVAVVTVEEKRWERLNDLKAIWLRRPADVSDDDYDAFYRAKYGSETVGAAAHKHLVVSGTDVEFKALLYVAERAPADYFDKFYTRPADIKLYVRRVFISDDFEDILPDYLRFVVGIVDSDTLPLNVSRETLQESAALRLIRRRLSRAALDMILDLVKRDEAKRSDDCVETDPPSGTCLVGDQEGEYDSFWRQWGKSLKLGLDDASNSHRVKKLLRFQSSHTIRGNASLPSPGRVTSLDEYVSRMPADQKQIYYLTGPSLQEVAGSPFTERLLARGFEVLYLTEPVDEVMMQSLDEYDDVRFQHVGKEDLEIDRDDRAALKEEAVRLKPFTDWYASGALASDALVDKVKISSRLVRTPAIVASAKFGWNANMERVMLAQALGDPQKQRFMRSKKILEINPRHPTIARLIASFESQRDAHEAAREAAKAEAEASGALGAPEIDPETGEEILNEDGNDSSFNFPDFQPNDETHLLARVIYETALIESGYEVFDRVSHSRDVQELLMRAQGLDFDLDGWEIQAADYAASEKTAAAEKRAEAARVAAEEEAAAEAAAAEAQAAADADADAETNDVEAAAAAEADVTVEL